MVKDRLEELKKSSGMRGRARDEETGPLINVHFQRLTEKMDEIRTLLSTLSSDLERLEKLHFSILASPHHDPNIGQSSERLVATLRTGMTRVANRCKEIKQEADEQVRKKHINATQQRMIYTMNDAFMAKFRALWSQLCKTETDFRTRCKDRIKRQLEIVGQEMTDDQVEDVLSKGANVSIFGRHLAECQAAKEALRDIEERHNDLLLLEHGIRELNQLFQELGLHIELQGETIDRIERIVVDSQSKVEKGERHLQKAAKTQKKTRKCKIIVGVVVAVIVAAAVAAVLFTVL